jgi:chitinase
VVDEAEVWIENKVSFGGWTFSKNFPGVAADAAKRALFIQESVAFADTYGFSGIDIDWEFPGPARGNTSGGSTADKDKLRYSSRI